MKMSVSDYRIILVTTFQNIPMYDIMDTNRQTDEHGAIKQS